MGDLAILAESRQAVAVVPAPEVKAAAGRNEWDYPHDGPFYIMEDRGAYALELPRVSFPLGDHVLAVIKRENLTVVFLGATPEIHFSGWYEPVVTKTLRAELLRFGSPELIWRF